MSNPPPLIIEEFYTSFGRYKTICKKHNITFDNGDVCKICFPKGGDVSTTLTLPSCSKERQKRVLDLYQEGYGYTKISRLLKISKQSTKELILRAIRNCENKEKLKRIPLTLARNTPLTLRLHNDEFMVKVLTDFNSINLPVVNKGRNLEYKLVLSDSSLFIKLHRNNTLTFRFKEDIIGLYEDEVFDKANNRLVDFLETFSYGGIVLVSTERVLSRHYGLLGSELARKVREDRTQVIIRDGGGKIRLRIDFSHDKPEIDAESVKTARCDINVTREYLQSILDKPHYKPDEAKVLIDFLQTDYVKANTNFTDKMNWLAENLKSHQRVLEGIEEAIRELRGELKK